MDADRPPGPDPAAAAALLGYLNFSDGRPDGRFQKGLDDAHDALTRAGEPRPWQALGRYLAESVPAARASGREAFRDLAQAEAVVGLVFDDLLPAYRRHHADLLAACPDADLFAPLFLARCCEAVLAQGGPWDERERVVGGSLAALNDYVGHRPVAVLESRPPGGVYDHEKVRPVPLYVRGAGVGSGKYHALVARALDVLRETPPDLLAEACFDPNLLDELAFDPRAYDHAHPANRRPNYLFGEWDPHHIDNQGRYRRFVVRKTTLDAVLERADADGELLFEAAAVLAGTVLMAAGTSGWGPSAHDSGVTLAKLVPRVARYRDGFYSGLIDKVGGAHGERLRAESKQTRQPFGGARQHLNQVLARQRAAQVQERQLAVAFAEMGYPEASRARAARIPTASVRVLSEIRLREAAADLALNRGDLSAAAGLLAEAEDLIHRGVRCGALADPWNVLGFSGLFPLFNAREDSVRDGRLDEVIEAVGRHLRLYARLLGGAALAGDEAALRPARAGMRRFAAWWDKYATAGVAQRGPGPAELPRVHGGERVEAAEHVARALARWREARQSRPGTPGAALSFWREYTEGFRSPAAYGQVVEALLRAGDRRAALGLLMAWLSQAEDVPLDDPGASFHPLAQQCVRAETDSAGLARFFELLEANADEFWQVPSPRTLNAPPKRDGDDFASAYEGVTFRDSADDGSEGSLMGDEPAGDEFTLEEDAPRLEQRLRFLSTVSRLWRAAARQASGGCEPPGTPVSGVPGRAGGVNPLSPTDTKTGGLHPPLAVANWLASAREHLRGLSELSESLHEAEVPEPVASAFGGAGSDAAAEFDRRRAVKEALTEAALAAAVEARRAVWVLAAAALGAPEPELSPDGGPDAPAWEAPAVELLRALNAGDAAAARRALPGVLRSFRTEPMLYAPLSDGGRPAQVLRARVAQAFAIDVCKRLPRLGLLRETYQLVRLTRLMEQNAPPGGRRVTEFDRVFRTGLQECVAAVLAAAPSWPNGGRPRQVTEWVRRVVDPFSQLWVAHSRTLRLSVLESLAGPVEWDALRQFVRGYGGDLFTPTFLNPGHVRGVLHKGVAAYLAEMADAPGPRPKLFDDLAAGKLSRQKAAASLEMVLSAVNENYEEYRDFNSSTTQSDYGDNLYLLLEFLKVRVGYDRLAWQGRPSLVAHGVLCREGRPDLAEHWRRTSAEVTRPAADAALDGLAKLERDTGMRLRTVRDRLEERFVFPLAVEYACSLVGPAVREVETGGGSFALLEAELNRMAATPTGVGLDVPQWLRQFEASVRKAREERPSPAPGESQKSALLFEDFQRQLSEWERPL